MNENARIVFQERVVGQIFRMRLHSPGIVRAARAGQFVMLRVREGTDPLLRRPFSFNRIHLEEGTFDILYRVVGRGTWLLSQLGPGETVSLIGPLGNGFELPVERTAPLAFVAGGIGIAPLQELIAQVLAARGPGSPRNMHLFYGARTASELLPEAALSDIGISVHYSTDDGSFGYNGRITKLFEEFLTESSFRPLELFSCGPLAMQYHVAKWALANDAPAQLSLESLMACGLGACLGCALPAAGSENPARPPLEKGGIENAPDPTLVKGGDSEPERFVHVCEDGPIFSAGSIKWNRILLQQTPPPTHLFS
ncbi:MAG: dihydroorotate dehydrogenase electron transfer subunit [Syntrophobacteraceae bacterium]